MLSRHVVSSLPFFRMTCSDFKFKINYQMYSPSLSSSIQSFPLQYENIKLQVGMLMKAIVTRFKDTFCEQLCDILVKPLF